MIEVTMSKIMIIRYETRPEAAEENERLVEQVFAELTAKDPGGLRYASFRMDDGVSFVHLAITEDEVSPLSGSRAFEEFQLRWADRVVPGTQTRAEATLIGAYRFLDA
jgi:hypothetical protein